MDLDRVYVYEGQHSVTFNNGSVSKNTWTDWGLIPSSRHSEPVNGVWNQLVTISGVNGQEDIVRSYPFNAINSYQKFISVLQNDKRDELQTLYGYDIYTPSNGSLSFLIADQTVSFIAKKQEIVNFLHNQVMTMTLADDPDKNYRVRTTISGFNIGDAWSSVTIAYSVLDES